MQCLEVMGMDNEWLLSILFNYIYFKLLNGHKILSTLSFITTFFYLIFTNKIDNLIYYIRFVFKNILNN